MGDGTLVHFQNMSPVDPVVVAAAAALDVAVAVVVAAALGVAAAALLLKKGKEEARTKPTHLGLGHHTSFFGVVLLLSEPELVAIAIYRYSLPAPA